MSFKMIANRFAMLVFTGGLWAVGCGGGDSPTNPVTPTPPTPPTQAPTVSVIEVSPNMATLDGGKTQRFTATAKASDGKVISGVNFTWSSSNTAVVTIKNNGVATAVTAGTATIRATGNGISSAMIPITVTVPAVSQVTISPSSTQELMVGEMVTFTAMARTAGGAVRSDVSFSWASSDTSVVTIASTGVATTVGAGTVTVRAEADGIASSPVTINVTEPPVVMSVRVECSRTPVSSHDTYERTPISVITPQSYYVLREGETMTCSVFAIYEDGSESIAAGKWNVRHPEVAVVNEDNVFTALSEGITNFHYVIPRFRGEEPQGNWTDGFAYGINIGVEARSPYYNDAFWREFAFNDYDCPSEEGCGQPIEERQLWRLPDPSPNVFILTTHFPPEYVRQIEAVAPKAIEELTGAPYSGRVVSGETDLIQGEPGWITFEALYEGMSGETAACEGQSVEEGAAYSAYAFLGAEIGCVVFNLSILGTDIPDVTDLIAHELGHSLGFNHLSWEWIATIGGGGFPTDGLYSQHERTHGHFAYTRERGETYAEIMLPDSLRAAVRARVAVNPDGGVVKCYLHGH